MPPHQTLPISAFISSRTPVQRCVIWMAISFLPQISFAELVDRGGGLIYDTEQNITWLKDANFAATSGFHSDGKLTWFAAMSWVSQLNYFDPIRNRYWNDWRLPRAGSHNDSEPCYGFNCINSEPAHLYNVDAIKRGNPGPFINFKGTATWTSSGRIPLPGTAWTFAFGPSPPGGIQDHSGPFEELITAYAWAVRDGDVGAPSINANPDTAMVAEGSGVSINLLENDAVQDFSNGDLILNIVSLPSNGEILISDRVGLVSYTHNGSETIEDFFTYSVTTRLGIESNIARVEIIIEPVNDPPLAFNDIAELSPQESTVVIDVLGNDTDPDNAIDPSSIELLTLPESGGVEITATGSMVYTSTAAQSDLFSYRVSDLDGSQSNIATVTVQKVPLNAAVPSAPTGDGLSGGASSPLTLLTLLGCSFILRIRRSIRHCRQRNPCARIFFCDEQH